MSVRNRTGVIRLEVGDNNRYMTLTVYLLNNNLLALSVLKDSNPYWTASKAEALSIMLKTLYMIQMKRLELLSHGDTVS